HPQAFAVRYATAPVPASPDRLAPSRQIARARATGGLGEHWVLAGMVNAAFDHARLARPEVIETRPLSTPDSPGGHVWRIRARLYQGVTLSQVRSALGRITSSLSAPWVQVTPDEE